jgi:hypothetical protein
MRIQFKRAGGFAAPAMNRNYTADLAELSAEDADELRRLVAQLDIAGLANHLINKPPRPDTFFYKVVVEDHGGQYTIQASDADMPASLRPLIDWLTKRS